MKLTGNRDIEGSLGRLGKLMQEEARMALMAVHNVRDDV